MEPITVYIELDVVRVLFGMMDEKARHVVLQSIFRGKRPFMISRSTFPSAGQWTGHLVYHVFSEFSE